MVALPVRRRAVPAARVPARRPHVRTPAPRRQARLAQLTTMSLCLEGPDDALTLSLPPARGSRGDDVAFDRGDLAAQTSGAGSCARGEQRRSRIPEFNAGAAEFPHSWPLLLNASRRTTASDTGGAAFEFDERSNDGLRPSKRRPSSTRLAALRCASGELRTLSTAASLRVVRPQGRRCVVVAWRLRTVLRSSRVPSSSLEVESRSWRAAQDSFVYQGGITFLPQPPSSAWYGTASFDSPIGKLRAACNGLAALSHIDTKFAMGGSERCPSSPTSIPASPRIAASRPAAMRSASVPRHFSYEVHKMLSLFPCRIPLAPGSRDPDVLGLLRSNAAISQPAMSDARRWNSQDWSYQPSPRVRKQRGAAVDVSRRRSSTKEAVLDLSARPLWKV